MEEASFSQTPGGALFPFVGRGVPVENQLPQTRVRVFPIATRGQEADFWDAVGTVVEEAQEELDVNVAAGSEVGGVSMADLNGFYHVGAARVVLLCKLEPL